MKLYIILYFCIFVTAAASNDTLIQRLKQFQVVAPNLLENDESVSLNGTIIERDNITYFFSFNHLNWFEAHHFCGQNQMILADMRTTADTHRVITLMTELDILLESYWFGMYDLGTKGDFYWVADGTPLTYSFWYPGEPNNENDKEDCGSTFINGAWNDGICLQPMQFICQSLNPACQQ